MVREKLKESASAVLTGAAVCAIAVAVLNNIGVFERPWLTFKALPQVALNADGTTPALGTRAKVKAGTVLPTYVYRCNSSDSVRSYVVTRYLNCKQHDPQPIPPNLAYLATGCGNVISRANLIPAGTPPDQCQIIGNAELSGKIKTFLVPFTTDWFEVVP